MTVVNLYVVTVLYEWLAGFVVHHISSVLAPDLKLLKFTINDVMGWMRWCKLGLTLTQEKSSVAGGQVV